MSSLPDGFTDFSANGPDFVPFFESPFFESTVPRSDSVKALLDVAGGGGALNGAAFMLRLPDGFTEAFPIVFEATLSLSSTGALHGAAEDS